MNVNGRVKWPDFKLREIKLKVSFNTQTIGAYDEFNHLQQHPDYRSI